MKSPADESQRTKQYTPTTGQPCPHAQYLSNRKGSHISGQARRGFGATALCLLVERKMKLQDIIADNKAINARARALNTRAGKEVFPILDYYQMEDHFANLLGGARRATEIKNPEALRLSDPDPELVRTVLDNNPDTIEVLGMICRVDYSTHQPSVDLSFEGETAGNWKQLPDEILLPSGRILLIKGFAEGVRYLEPKKPADFKDRVRESLEQLQWERWKKDKPKMAPVDPGDDQSTVPFITVVYGQCPLTEKDLMVYGTVEATQYLSESDHVYWRPIWSRSRSEAAGFFDHSVKKLAEAKKNIAEIRAQEQSRAG